MPVFSRRRLSNASQSGRPLPSNIQTTNLDAELPKDDRERLYQMNLPDPSSPIVSTTFTNFPRYKAQNSSSSSPSCHSPTPLRSPSIPPQSINSCGEVNFPKLGSINRPPPILQLTKRMENIPPPDRLASPAPQSPYLSKRNEEFSPACSSLTQPPARTRTLSASSWIKRVISRSSSRNSLRKQYEQIPPSEEEQKELDRMKENRAQEAIKEWNRINEAIRKAGL
ncbi:hypothetical protein BY996DRAFT_4575653 [Phakopsora pachyrhizi]|uniref:Uncharacterized protein n=1 Tax=Phakopsora pachyrhizi TaxID=170000 RepID=A0AAV0AV63_PHAPC|nr:hypothetical protein BY996DRAFT_4575653 [Phakopsora pachyrhizi]CAH7672421.1 hypothetical protein PPACK8108_LOCUS7238 [Phakopsora pachyrhizi]